MSKSIISSKILIKLSYIWQGNTKFKLEHDPYSKHLLLDNDR